MVLPWRKETHAQGNSPWLYLFCNLSTLPDICRASMQLTCTQALSPQCLTTRTSIKRICDSSSPTIVQSFGIVFPRLVLSLALAHGTEKHGIGSMPILCGQPSGRLYPFDWVLAWLGVPRIAINYNYLLLVFSSTRTTANASFYCCRPLQWWSWRSWIAAIFSPHCPIFITTNWTNPLNNVLSTWVDKDCWGKARTPCLMLILLTACRCFGIFASTRYPSISGIAKVYHSFMSGTNSTRISIHVWLPSWDRELSLDISGPLTQRSIFVEDLQRMPWG